MARYAREPKHPNPRNHRRWTTQTAALEDLACRSGDSAVVLALANRLDLHLRALVRIARLLVSLLVRLQSETRFGRPATMS